MGFMRCTSVSVQVALSIIFLGPTIAMSQGTETDEAIVPQNLLKLIHTSEVQRELGLEGDKRLLLILKDIDRVWWPARILPELKQVEKIKGLEEKLLDALKPILSTSKLRRLREIEVQSQGTRSLVRPEIAKAVGINDRFLFINELFRGDETMYERSIKTINSFNIYAEAEYWISRELKLKLGWNNDHSSVQHFDQLVKRRFS